jgi:hypothetical protein
MLIVTPATVPYCESVRLQLSGDTAAARALVRATLGSPPADANGSVRLGYASVVLLSGDTARARQELATVVGMYAHQYVREDAIAETYYRLGDIDSSIEWWRRAVESNGSLVIDLAKDAEFAPLRKDPRVQALLVKAGIR